ncbi:MATE family efflux transporter [Bacteroidia bacterium]|nr:MATE family efflux transporter [Bacteroidia bacterium]
MSTSDIRNLTEGKIFKQLIQIAVPIMATSFIQMAYTLTDMAWLGRLGSEEMAAVGAMGIVLWLISSVALLTKVGAEISIAQCIGAKQTDKARIYASHNVTIALILGIGVSLFLFFSATLIISLFKLDAKLAEMAHGYLQIVCISLPMFILSYTFSGIYNGIGRTTVPFYFLTAGLLCNMLLDPLLIFGIKGFGALHTEGAAVATVISQIVVILLFIWKTKQKNGILNRFPYFVKLQKKYTIHIVKLGAPIAAMNFLFAGINFYMARIASIYGGYLGVMSQTTGSQIEGISWNTSQGFSTALATFTAQNYAANKIDRTTKAYKYTLTTLLSLGVIVTLAFGFLGKEIFGLFVIEDTARIAGGNYLFIMAFSQMFMMIEITTMGLWNGFGRTIPPATVSILFNLARIPLALGLAHKFGISGVWIAITVSAILKGIISPIWWQIVFRTKIKKY